MRIVSIIIAVFALALFSTAHAVETEKAPAEGKAPGVELNTLDEKVSYLVGLDMAKKLKTMPIELDLGALMRGIEDMLKDRKPLFTQEESMAIQQEYRAKAEAEMKIRAEKNKAEGEIFLAQNKKLKGVVTTKSGLQYQVIKEGDGPTPKITDKVKMNYIGTLVDGTEFFNTYKNGQPMTVDVKPAPMRPGVIRGWTEAFQLMKVGAKYRVFIPSSLAFGENPPPGPVGPNAVLINEIELLSIEPPTFSPPSPMGAPPGNRPSPEEIQKMLNKAMKESMEKIK